MEQCKLAKLVKPVCCVVLDPKLCAAWLQQMHEQDVSEQHHRRYKQKCYLLPVYAARSQQLPKLAAAVELLSEHKRLTYAEKTTCTYLTCSHIPTDVAGWLP